MSMIVMLNGLMHVMLNLILHLSKEIAGQARNDGCFIRPHGRFNS